MIYGLGLVIISCATVFVLVNTTAPVLASILPSAVAPEPIVMDVKAITVPLNEVPSPMVADVPTCQKTFLARAPPVRITLPYVPPPPPVVISADPIWKIQTAFASPLRVRLPFSSFIEDADL